MSNTEALKPCPFCGGDAPETCEQEGRHYVVCYGCALESPFQDSRAEAVAAWNRRAAIAAPPGWVLVPVEPTPAMQRAAVESREGRSVYKVTSKAGLEALEDIAADDYRAMLAAAPDAQKGPA